MLPLNGQVFERPTSKPTVPQALANLRELVSGACDWSGERLKIEYQV